MTKAIALFDGQNLYHMARYAFGTVSAQVNPQALARAVCRASTWNLVESRYYTGIHSSQKNAKLNAAVQAHIYKMQSIGVQTYVRTLRYQDGIAREKGIDMRIALDAINAVHSQSIDVVLLFSQDQDFVELAEEVRRLNRQLDRKVVIASAFPNSTKVRGIDKTDWKSFSKADYLAALF